MWLSLRVFEAGAYRSTSSEPNPSQSPTKPYNRTMSIPRTSRDAGWRDEESQFFANTHKISVVKFSPDDIPNRFELFLLDDGQQKVEYKEETRVPNTAIFTFNKEDHTLGNLLSQRLLKYDYIVFSAYKVPHPLFATFELRVQTDGTITPKEAIVRCCKDIVQDLHVLNSSFQTEWLGKKIVSEGEADRIARERDAF